MQRIICQDRAEMSTRAAAQGAEILRQSLRRDGQATLVLATGTSQFEVLALLLRAPDLAWEQITCFHLDEYLSLSPDHPASFCRYLRERFLEKLPRAPRAFHFINGRADPAAECARLGQLISERAVDLAFLGIGENGHLAFNDPPADFLTSQPYLRVALDEACRRQQVGEGWFKMLDDVPKEAITMSIRQIMKATAIICCAPERRKAVAVRDALEGIVTPQLPASILQQHPSATLYLDPASAHLLSDNS